MGLFDSLIGAISGHSNTPDGATHPLGTALTSLLTQNGGVQGLMTKFSQGGLGDVFSSWVGVGENKSISADQITSLLGSEQVHALASKLGVDPTQASSFLAEYLPKIVDKLTPAGQVDPSADHTTGIAALLPSLLSSFGRGDSGHA